MANYRTKDKKEYALSRPYVSLGAYLAKAREKKGLTQREISNELGYSSAQFISNFERGISSPPTKRLKTLINMLELKQEKVINLMLEGTKEASMALLKF